MSLSCSCDYNGGGEFAWYYIIPKDYEKLATKRRKRCSSCSTLIDVGAICLIFTRTRPARYEVEYSIYGDDGDVPISSMHHCEACADMFFNLRELGFECILPDEDVRQLVKQYQEVYLKKEAA